MYSYKYASVPIASSEIKTKAKFCLLQKLCAIQLIKHWDERASNWTKNRQQKTEFSGILCMYACVCVFIWRWIRRKSIIRLVAHNLNIYLFIESRPISWLKDYKPYNEFIDSEIYEIISVIIITIIRWWCWWWWWRQWWWWWWRL